LDLRWSALIRGGEILCPLSPARRCSSLARAAVSGWPSPCARHNDGATSSSPPRPIVFGKAITELFELLLGDLEIPRGFNRPPALLKLERIRFVEMSLGIRCLCTVQS